jgi:uncharacterized membrane protein
MKKLRIVLGVLITTLGLAAIPATANAAPGQSYTQYDIMATLNQDGTADVTMNVALDFSRNPGRGPVFSFVIKSNIPNDNRYRVTDIKNFRITSPTGADTSVSTEESDNGYARSYRIGDQDTYYRNVQQYVVSYTATGLLAPNDAVSGFDKFDWSAIGNQGDLPILNPSVTITAPFDVSDATCFYGRDFRTECSASHDANTAKYSVDSLNAGEGMEVATGFPVGSFSKVNIEYGYQPTVSNLFRITPATGITALIVLVVGVVGAIAARRRFGSDHIFVGLAPGNLPAPGQKAAQARGSFDTIPVAFAPPKGVRPAEGSYVLKRSATNATLDSTLIDLAVRGYLVVEPGQRDDDTTFHRTNKPATGLLPYESAVLDAIFDGKTVANSRKLSKSQRAAKKMMKAKSRLTRQVQGYHWFGIDPSALKVTFFMAGAVVAALGVFLSVSLVQKGWGLVSIAVLLAGVVVIITAFGVSNRTAVGSAVYAQAEGFKQYLSTAEADQLKWEAGQDIFSQYLPWAAAFGVAERWAALFQKLAAEGRYDADLYWMAGGNYWYTMNLAHTIGSMTHSIDSMITSATANYAQSGISSALGGGGGFSGGGGGFGGGGSSSW